MWFFDRVKSWLGLSSPSGNGYWAAHIAEWERNYIAMPSQFHTDMVEIESLLHRPPSLKHFSTEFFSDLSVFENDTMNLKMRMELRADPPRYLSNRKPTAITHDMILTAAARSVMMEFQSSGYANIFDFVWWIFEHDIWKAHDVSMRIIQLNIEKRAEEAIENLYQPTPMEFVDQGFYVMSDVDIYRPGRWTDGR